MNLKVDYDNQSVTICEDEFFKVFAKTQVDASKDFYNFKDTFCQLLTNNRYKIHHSKTECVSAKTAVKKIKEMELPKQIKTRLLDEQSAIKASRKEVAIHVRDSFNEAEFANEELMEFEFSGRPLVELGDESPVYKAIAAMMEKIL